MIKSINSNSLQAANTTWDLIIQALNSGFAGLELSLEPSGPLGETPWENLIKEIADSDLKIPALTTTQFDLFTLAGLDGDSERVKAIDTYNRLLHHAAGIQDATVIISAHDRHSEDRLIVDKYEISFHTLFQSINKIADFAEHQSVPITFENPAAGLLVSPLELRDFIDQINNPYVGLCLNPHHAAHLGNPLDWLRIQEQRISTVRLQGRSLACAVQDEIYPDLLAILKKQNRNIPLIYRLSR